MRHAGAVDLGVDVADKVGFEVEILDQRQWVVGLGFCGMLVEDLDGIVAAESGFERRTEQLVTHRSAQDGHGVEVAFHRAAGDAFKGGLGAEDAWCPVRFRVELAQCAEDGAAQAQRQGRTHLFFHQVKPVATVAAEALVAAVA